MHGARARPAHALLNRFGLGEAVDRYPWQLSGGMRQRAAICRVMLSEPAILLMDEPFGALDAMTRDDLNVEVIRMWQASRRTVVFVTHSIAQAVFLSDRVAVRSCGPGRIEEVVTIDLPPPRALGVRELPRFAPTSRSYAAASHGSARRCAAAARRDGDGAVRRGRAGGAADDPWHVWQRR